MNIARRRVAALAAALAVLAIAAGPAGAQSTHHEDAVQRANRASAPIGVAPAPCQDSAFRLFGAKWTKPFEWSFRASTTPAGLNTSTVAAILQRSFSNITDARNDCGRADAIDATHSYLGTTGRRPDCGSRDGHNVVGFGRLPLGVLAVTCYWIRSGQMVEADIKINSRESWALALDSCNGRPMLEATITHEAGHVFGLDHIGERRHGRLTMSPYLDGPCENDEASLGLGDLLGLEQLY